MLTLEEALDKVPSNVKAAYLGLVSKGRRRSNYEERLAYDIVYAIKNAIFKDIKGCVRATHNDLALVLDMMDEFSIPSWGAIWWWHETPKYWDLWFQDYAGKRRAVRIKKGNNGLSSLIDRLERREV